MKKHKFLKVLAVVFALLVLNKFYQDYQKRKFFEVPIGKIVEANNQKLNINATGNGTTTVVLISGGSSWSMDWYYIQSQLSPNFNVISYDRAGFGWSSLPSEPYNCNRALAEFEQVIIASKKQPPYILVGASYGGHIARLYAQKYPKDVEGIVLLDARHEQISSKLPKTMKEIEDLGVNINNGAAFVEKIGMIRLLGFIAGEKNKPKALNNLPVELHNTYLNVAFSQNFFKANNIELKCINEVDKQVSKCSNLGNIPLITISHGKPEIFENIKSANAENAEAVWQNLQVELAKLSTNSKRITATKSGHLIQFDEPNLVLQAINEVLTMNSPNK
jgi:pimeloyl-ACP methyl ester carboxylesterase